MGKRLPKSKKHKKLKFVDPSYSGVAPQLKNKKQQPNEPPQDGDFQYVPRNMTELINLKNKVKSGKLKRKKRKKKVIKDDFIVVRRDTTEDIDGASKPLKNLPTVLKQKPNESEKHFFGRLQNMTNCAIAEAKIEQKYGIELVNIDSQGNAQYKTKEVSDNKIEKRKKYKEKEIEKKKNKMDESKFDLRKEEIDFGEVAMAPPIFTAKPRKAPVREKPGKKELYLKNILGSNKNKETHSNPIRWKDLPSEKRKVIENERSRAVQMYRILKSKKSIN